jgi:RHS repeat-associated protein
MTQSGNATFQQSYTASNQVNGFVYDAAGELTGDTINAYTYNAEGLLTGTGNGTAQYIYDALEQRVEKLSGSNVGEVIYFNGHPIARLTATSSGSALNWTSDLLWAGDSLLAELGQSTTYRLLDHEGSLALATDGSGNVLGANVLTPYGQNMNEQLSDAYTWAGLFQDTEYSGHAAWYRDYSGRAARWLTPDPYNGSYDIYNPQSFNRYMYVNGNPLGYVDPSGLAGGWATGWGGVCTLSGGTDKISTGNTFNPCDPIAYFATVGVYGVMQSFGFIGSINEVTPVITAAITIACSIDNFNKSACGPSGWTSVFIGGDAGKVVNDTIAAIGATAGVVQSADTLAAIEQGATATGCLAGGPVDLACDVLVAYDIYAIANALFSELWSEFSGPQFKGSLLPRPRALGGLRIVCNWNPQ